MLRLTEILFVEIVPYFLLESYQRLLIDSAVTDTTVASLVLLLQFKTNEIRDRK